MEIQTPSSAPQRPSSDRNFGFVMAIFFSVLAALPWIKRRESPNLLFIGIAVFFAMFALLYPKILRPLNILWTKLGLLLHKITNPIILSAIFFLVITPIAVLMRLIRQDPLRRKFTPHASSYWIPREAPKETDSMKNQF